MMPTIPSEPRDAVETAYRVFASYRIGRAIDFAARVSASDEERALLRAMLTGMPLRTLPLEAIDAYLEYIDAAYYDGAFPADEFRYFLPRALELLASGKPPHGAPWMRERLERILVRGQARAAWPANEAAAIDRVLAPLRAV
jgi:hypothetical protein